MRHSRRRQQRGWALVMVMLVLLGLGLAVAGYYSQTEDHLFTGQSMAAYNTAASRADLGAQRAVADIRSGLVPLINLTTPCTDGPGVNVFTACAAPNMGYRHINSVTMMPGPDDGGNVLDLRVGGGLQFDYMIYRPNIPFANQGLYTIRSIGYYGYSGSANLYSSDLEVTIEVGSSNDFKCNSYDCS